MATLISLTADHQPVIEGGAGVVIGTHRSYGTADAGVHQFGTHRAGRNHNVTIPARPFLGLSATDEATVLSIIQDALDEA
ncbi:MAG: phage virion morphogenesis protein [Azoarcus sp.]|jgi:phage virion morphogenesis protein|nr:phage virion morphogenesis protein [Azoarcus sp.]